MSKSVIETLESRVLLSGAPSHDLNVVSIHWRGHVLQAVQNEYIIQTKKNLNLNSVAQKLNLPIDGITDLGGGGFYKFQSTAAASRVSGWESKYRGYISAISPNEIFHTTATVPDDPFYATDQWHLNNTGQTIDSGFGVQTGTPGADIDAEKAWDISRGDTETDPHKQIIVAVLDSGIDLTHPDLAGNIFVNTDEIPGDGIDNDGNGYIDDINGWNTLDDTANVTDDNGHGTHVSGIIGARGNNTTGVTGVNWSVKVLPVKNGAADGSLTGASIVGSFRYVARMKEMGWNIVVANGSFGGSAFPFDEVESRAVEQLGERGVLLVVAAGNDSVNVDRVHDFPSKYSLNLSNVITVAATDNQDNLAFFSNFGAASVQVAAPGLGIKSTFPLTLDSDGTPDGYFVESGTSQATPIVTGIIALERSIKPDATMAELKKALIDSAEPIASLASVNHLPPKVTTGGRVNAFRALKNIVNQAVGQDTLRQGNWQGAYGADGAYVVGESVAFPAFVEGRITGNSTQVELAASSKRPEALQKPSNAADRVVAYLATSTEMTIDLNFTDGVQHRVGLYAADLDHKGRIETISLIDADSGVVTDTQTLSKFNKGKYLFWDVTGHVQIKLSVVKGPNAVFSGLFFDTPPANDALFFKSDSTTRGQWTTKYGSQGAIVVGDSLTAPSFVTVTPLGKTDLIEVPTTKDLSALQKNTNIFENIVAFWSSQTTFDVNLTFNDADAHRTSLYFQDFRNRHRQQKIEIFDSTGTTLLNRQDINSFKNGRYLTFDLSGSVIIRITNLAGPNAVLNGIFFDATASAPVQFLGADRLTRGNWRNSRYGTLTQYIPGFSGLFSDFNASQLEVSLTDITGIVQQPIFSSTPNKSALQLPTNAFNRRLTHMTSSISLTIDIQFLDNRTHRLAMYAADVENLHRAQRIEIIDAVTGEVLSSNRLINFKNGKYLVWNVRGHVQLKVTAVNPAPPIVDGLFFD